MLVGLRDLELFGRAVAGERVRFEVRVVRDLPPLTLVEGEAWPIALDDRIDMYPSDVVDDYLTLLRAEEGWGAVLEAWEVDVVVWETDRPLAGELATSGEWRIVYLDGTWLAACRTGSASCDALRGGSA